MINKAFKSFSHQQYEENHKHIGHEESWTQDTVSSFQLVKVEVSKDNTEQRETRREKDDNI